MRSRIGEANDKDDPEMIMPILPGERRSLASRTVDAVAMVILCDR
jgi:hypothetical protein